MKKLLILTILLAPAIWSNQLNALTIAYVVNNSTDTTTGLTYDKQWIRFLANNMGYTVNVITDDSAGAITSVNAYDGYFLSATMNSANLTNLRSTTKGVVICDQLMYDDFLVASNQTASVIGLSYQSTLNRVDSTHAITKYMFNKIYFSFSSTTYHYANTGLPQGATVLFTPSARNWDGSVDTAYCYAIDTGDSLVGAVAAGRRVVALSHYGLLTSETDAGWCHPYELMGNICGWAFGDEENAYNSGYNCYSTDIATDPGPEVNQGWAEYGVNYRYIYSNGRVGYDSRVGLMFLQSRYWSRKAMPGFEPDSFKITYKIPYRGFGTDNPPHLYDTVSIVSVNSSTSMTIDTTTRNYSTVSKYDWYFQGSQSYGIVIRSGVGADTTQRGDTCRISAPSSSHTSAAVTYIIGAANGGATVWNGTAGGSMRMLVADPYGGMDFWLKMYAITPTTVWTAPLVSQGGGNPEGSATRTWINRNFIKSGNTDSVRWNATDLTPGTDHPQAAIDSFRVNRTTFSPDGTSTMDFIIPGSYLNNDNFNWVVFKSIDSSGGGDSTDIEIAPNAVTTTRGSYVQKFELYLSGASPLTLGVDDTIIAVTSDVDDPDYEFTIANVVRNTGDGVLAIDSIRDDKSWLLTTSGGSGGSTPLNVEHLWDNSGTAGVDTATVTVYAATASNTPLLYYIIRTLTTPPVDVPPATVEKRTGLRVQ